MATLPDGKYSLQRFVTSAAMSSRHDSSFGYHGFMRASMTTGPRVGDVIADDAPIGRVNVRRRLEARERRPQEVHVASRRARGIVGEHDERPAGKRAGDEARRAAASGSAAYAGAVDDETAAAVDANLHDAGWRHRR